MITKSGVFHPVGGGDVASSQGEFLEPLELRFK
jgi:hypothetical protein